VIAGQSASISQDGTGGTIFTDVPQTYGFYEYIRAIFIESITNGCGNGQYCPDLSVTREQMAAFLIRTIEGEHDASYCNSGSPFTDVLPDSVFCGDIKRFSELGITTVVGTYDPKGCVTRGQMAAFVIRAKYGENFTYTQTPYFSDVPSTHNFFKYVQKLKDDKITTVSGTYGVDDIVTRAQMAAFLARGFLGME
jgi:hypothetical protein